MSAELQQPVFRPTDEAQPKAERSPAPILLIALFTLMFYWGCTHLADHGGGFSPVVYRPYGDFDILTAAQPPNIGNPYHDGQLVYGRICVACHQPSGLGTPGQFPPLAGSEWVNAQAPDRIIHIVLQGLRGPITVKNQGFGAVEMAHWRDVLTDDKDIAAVLTYVRGNKDWGNNAPPVPPEKVKAIRAETEKRPLNSPYTVEELKSFPE